jgi:hypothetical protein
VAGAWRSLRYDLERRQSRKDDGEETTDLIFPEYGTAQPPRRLLAAGGFGALAIAGAAGTYFAVATGLGLLVDDAYGGQPGGLPAAAGGPPGVHDLGAAELPANGGGDGVGNGVGDGKATHATGGKGLVLGIGKGEALVREGRKGGRITAAGRRAAIEEAGGVSGPAAVPTPTRTTPGPRPTTPRPSTSTSTSPSGSPTPSPSPSSTATESPSPSPSPSGPGEGTGEPTGSPGAEPGADPETP